MWCITSTAKLFVGAEVVVVGYQQACCQIVPEHSHLKIIFEIDHVGYEVENLTLSNIEHMIS